MIGWIILGVLLYLIIGFFYATIIIFLYVSEVEIDRRSENETGGSNLIFFMFCTLFWIILIPITLIYKLYEKIKGGNKNE